MLSAFLWGLVAASSLIVGGLIAYRILIGPRVLGCIMAFGAGMLISAVSYELVFESVVLAKLSGFPALGFFAGALAFYFSDRLIERLHAGRAGEHGGDGGEGGLVVPMVLGIILDGVPESIVIGLGLSQGGEVGIAMLAAVFVSNLPESIAGSIGLKAGGASRRRIVLLWLLIALVCAAASAAGFGILGGASARWMSFIQAFAGGAILMMLANSMIPEAYERGGKLAGVFTVLGFFIAVTVVIFERS